jgi:hypothetical protein
MLNLGYCLTALTVWGWFRPAIQSTFAVRETILRHSTFRNSLNMSDDIRKAVVKIGVRLLARKAKGLRDREDDFSVRSSQEPVSTAFEW